MCLVFANPVCIKGLRVLLPISCNSVSQWSAGWKSNPAWELYTSLEKLTTLLHKLDL